MDSGTGHSELQRKRKFVQNGRAQGNMTRSHLTISASNENKEAKSFCETSTNMPESEEVIGSGNETPSIDTITRRRLKRKRNRASDSVRDALNNLITTLESGINKMAEAIAYTGVIKNRILWDQVTKIPGLEFHQRFQTYTWLATHNLDADLFLGMPKQVRNEDRVVDYSAKRWYNSMMFGLVLALLCCVLL